MRRTLYAVICSLVFFIHISSAFGDMTLPFGLKPASENSSVEEKWRFYEKILNKTVNSALNYLLPHLTIMFNERNSTMSQCKTDVLRIISGLRKIKSWAFRFLDSSGKTIDGLLYASTSSFGSYDECVDTVVTEKEDSDGEPFSGMYCSIDMAPALPPKPRYYKLDRGMPELNENMDRRSVVWRISYGAALFYFHPYRMGICVPSSCTLQDINKGAQIFGKHFAINVRTSRCEVKEEMNYNRLQISILCLYGFTIFLLIVGTAIDLYNQRLKTSYKSTMLDFLLAFSLNKNFSKFVTLGDKSRKLSCFNGMRFFSMAWIMIAHTYLVVNKRVNLDLIKRTTQMEDLSFQAPMNASLAVDTFFFMGALLLCYLTVKLVRYEHHPFNVKLIIIRRLWRILPVYVYAMLSFFLLDLVGSGPIWHESTGFYIEDCYSNWWSNLLFINNLIDPYHMCIPQSWYLSSDFQLFIVALVVSSILLKSQNMGIFVAFLLVAASVICCGILTYIMDLPPTMLMVTPDDMYIAEFWGKFYFQPYPHAGPYFIGYITGYLLAVKPDIKIPKAVLSVGWTMATVVNTLVVYGTYPWNCGQEMSPVETALYSAFHRSAWTLGLAWMVFCCCTGHGGIINTFLSWKVFLPLSRLTFATYLMHPIVMLYFGSCIKTQIQSEHVMWVWFFLGHLFVSYGIGFIFNMVIESPMMSLEKVIFKTELNTKNENACSSINNEKYYFDKKRCNEPIKSISLQIDCKSK